MPDIEKIICGKLPRLLPNGEDSAVDYMELQAGSDGKAVLIRHKGGNDDTFDVTDIELQTVLEETEQLIKANPDEQPYPEELPFAKDITYSDGTVKYAPKDELRQILDNLVLLITLKNSGHCQPQGLVAAPNTDMNFTGLQMMHNYAGQAQETPPMLQGIVRALPPSEAPEDEKWKCSCGAENSGKFCYCCGSPKPEKMLITENIYIITVGRMTFYLPNGNSNPADLLQLFYFKEKGAVIVSGSADKPLTVKPDDSALAETISAVEALLAENSDFPCEKRPFFNEVYMKEGICRYAPREELYNILGNLYRSASAKEFHELPRPAGAVAMNTAPPQPVLPQQIELKQDRKNYRLKVEEGMVRFTLLDAGNDLFVYKFKADHPAFSETATLISFMHIAACSESGGTHKITFADGSEINADPEKLASILDDLRDKLEADSENVEINVTPREPALAGAVALNPQKEALMNAMYGTMPGMMMQQNAPQPQPPEPKHSAALHDDGSWDCACGAKGLTSKFCYSCGAAKPSVWKCDCGAENTSKFCNNCGKPRP